MLNSTTQRFRPPKYRAQLNSGTIEPESLLWRAVVCRGIQDIASPDDRTRSAAIRWLKTKDFVTVCDLAMIEPDSLRPQLANLATLPLAVADKYIALMRAFVLGEDE